MFSGIKVQQEIQRQPRVFSKSFSNNNTGNWADKLKSYKATKN